MPSTPPFDPLEDSTIPLAFRPHPEIAEEPPGRWIPAPGPEAKKALTASVAVSLAVYGIFAFSGNLRDRPVLFLGGWAVLAVCFVAGLSALRRCRRPARPVVLFVLVAGLAFRGVMLVSSPGLSDDLHRSITAGQVQLGGHNPYAGRPDDPALGEERLPPRERIDEPEILDDPPGAEILFAAAAFVRPSPFVLRALLVLLETALLAGLAAGLHRADRSPLAIALWAWHPLAVVEVAGSGHVDGLAALLLAAATAALVAGRKIGSALALAGSVSVKLLAAVTAPFFLRRLSGWHALLAAATLIVLAAPYVAGAGGGVLDGLGRTALRPEFNGSVYPLLEKGIERLAPQPALRRAVDGIRDFLHVRQGRLLVPDAWYETARLARALAAALLLCALTAIALRNMAPEREVFAGLAAAVILSPVVQSWLLLWLLPPLVLLGAGPRWREPSAVSVVRRSVPPPPSALAWSATPWLWLTLAAPLSYLAYASPQARVPAWVRAVEYLPMIPLALWEAAAARRGWFTEDAP